MGSAGASPTQCQVVQTICQLRVMGVEPNCCLDNRECERRGLPRITLTEGDGVAPIRRPGAVIVADNGLGLTVAERDMVGRHGGISPEGGCSGSICVRCSCVSLINSSMTATARSSDMRSRMVK